MKSLFSLLLALALALTSIPVKAESWGNEAHYIVMRQLADGSIQPLSYQRVQMAAPMQTLAEKDLQSALKASPLGDRQQYLVRLQDAHGQTQYQNIVRVPTLMRGEFASSLPEGNIEGHQIPMKETFFVVRVPIIPQTRLALLDGSKNLLAEFDPQQLSTDSTLRPANSTQAYTVTPVQVTGSPANRLDLVILGDGYTAAQQSDFDADTNWVYGGFFNISPLTEYKNYHNVYAIFSPSNQSGSDHPPYKVGCPAGDTTCCGDTYMQSDPLRGQMVDTVFDSTYCYYNIYRLLWAVDYASVYTVAAAVPDWDTILVMVNDTTYGGAGGGYAVFSVNSNAIEIAKHEFGHSFGLLADEYDYGTPDSCNDLDANPANDCAVNVTNAATRAFIKWRFWIQDTTPIPTPETSTYSALVGLFEGAIYNPTGYYRSGLDCLMKNLNRPFCPVPGQAMILRLYEGGWGNPVGGIQIIEPGSTLPATATITATTGDTITFSATILKPLNSPVSITWLVNDLPQVGWNSEVFTYTASSAGSFQIDLQVTDQTPQVLPVMSSGMLNFEHFWTLQVSTPPIYLYLPSLFNLNETSKSPIH